MQKFYSAFSFLISLSFLLSSSAFAQIQETSEALTRFEQNVSFTTLSNGLRVIIYPRRIAPVFSGAVVVRVGGSDEQPGKSGIAHMLEHMAFKGTQTVGTKDYIKEQILLNKLDDLATRKKEGAEAEIATEWNQTMQQLRELWITDQFSREYDKRGAVGLNAYTSSETTAYFVDLPKSAFEFWCYMESERLINPVMRQFYEERAVVLEERRMRFEDDPEGKLYQTLLSNAYKVHPYGKPVIGYEQDLQELTANELSEFHHEYYLPSEMVLSLAGDIDPVRDLALLEKYFGRISEGKAGPRRPVAVEPAQTDQRDFSIEMGANPQTMIAYHKPVYPDPADPVITVLAEILAGSKLSPLVKTLVEDKKLSVSVSTSEAPGNAYPNLLIFSLTPKAPHSNSELLTAFDQALTDFKTSWNNEELLMNAKRSVAMTFLGNLKSNQGLALGLASDLVIYGSYKTSSKWFAEAMQVTTEQIKAAAAKYLVNENRTIGRLEAKGGM